MLRGDETSSIEVHLLICEIAVFRSQTKTCPPRDIRRSGAHRTKDYEVDLAQCLSGNLPASDLKTELGTATDYRIFRDIVPVTAAST